METDMDAITWTLAHIERNQRYAEQLALEAQKRIEQNRVLLEKVGIRRRMAKQHQTA